MTCPYEEICTSNGFIEYAPIFTRFSECFYCELNLFRLQEAMERLTMADIGKAVLAMSERLK